VRRRRAVSPGVLGIALLLVAAPWAQSQQAPVRRDFPTSRCSGSTCKTLRAEVVRYRGGKSVDEMKPLVRRGN
jgi:hypothetical protein